MYASIWVSALLVLAVGSGASGRAFPDVQIFVNVFCSGETDASTGGCRTGMGEDGAVCCGQQASACEVRWSWKRTEAGADYYEVTGSLPVSENETRVETKEVRYEGRKVLLWQDEKRRIWMLPSEKTQ